MKIKWIKIDNYSHFRRIFESDADADLVIRNLTTAILKDINNEGSAHISLQYWVHYDDEGLAGFEIVQVKFAYQNAYINVNYLSTAK